MLSQPRVGPCLKVDEINGVTVVNFIDKNILDEQIIYKIAEELLALVDELGRKKVLLNFSNVEYLSSACIGKFLTLLRKLERLERRHACPVRDRSSYL